MPMAPIKRMRILSCRARLCLQWKTCRQSLPVTSLWRRGSKCSIFDSIKEHLLHQKQHEDNLCKCTFVSLTKFISGVGGTGKSFIIEAIKQLTDSIWQSEDLKRAITAPTGLAAFNVGGVTIQYLASTWS